MGTTGAGLTYKFLLQQNLNDLLLFSANNGQCYFFLVMRTSLRPVVASLVTSKRNFISLFAFSFFYKASFGLPRVRQSPLQSHDECLLKTERTRTLK